MLKFFGVIALILGIIIMLLFLGTCTMCGVAVNKGIQEVGKEMVKSDMDEAAARGSLEVIDSSWSMDDSFGMAHWKITIKNTSISDFKDPNIKVTYFGESGTEIYTSIMGHTEYVIILAGKSVIIEFDDIMAGQQAFKARVFVDDATKL